MTKKNIPIHKLETFTSFGLMLLYLDGDNDDWLSTELINMEMHRDDYYIFMVAEKCEANLTVDFKHFEIRDKSIFYIVPGQVQSNLPELNSFTGWGIAVEPNLIEDLYRRILTDNLLNHRSLSVGNREFETLVQNLAIMNKELAAPRDNMINNRILISLLDVFVGMFTRIYHEQQEANINTNSRPFLITSEFRKLLSKKFKTMKSPSQYAEALRISVSYLNEVVKKTTGFSVSHWILQENMLEAKRLLYHSNMNVKEIAFAIGYDDHTYFSRLYSNSNGESPLKFRRRHRE